ncbi:cytochrome P450 [Mycena vulgaris]|nr:cytochrome P450 [Mycena vulgaris]
MLANPEAQKKAQMEIYSVVGSGRLLDFDDEDSLPYVSAIVKKVLRWRSATPIAIPQFLPVEDQYKGYRLPAGSIVIPNSWEIFTAMYPDPYAFNPDRFLLDGKPNPAFRKKVRKVKPIQTPNAETTYGMPRRRMASSSVWIAAVSVPAAFHITKRFGDDAQIIEPTYEYFPGLVSMPLPFKCFIKPRSRRAVDLIHTTINDEEQA